MQLWSHRVTFLWWECSRSILSKFPFLKKSLILYQNLVDLQCCYHLRCTTKWFSDIYMYMFFFRIFSHIVYNRFQIYNTVLLTLGTRLYIRFSEPIHFKTNSLYPLISIPQFHLSPQPISNYPLLCSCEFCFCFLRFCIWVISYTVCLSLSSLFLLAWWLPYLSTLSQMAGFLPFYDWMILHCRHVPQFLCLLMGT